MRHKSLDGLRGLAAMSVLLFHSSFVFASPINPTLSGHWLIDLFSFSPLRLPFLGAEAVHLFFLLSGFTLPMFASKLPLTSGRYFLSRFVRLYVPVWVAIGIFALAQFYSDRHVLESPRLTVADWLKDGILVFGAGKTIGALWSLSWEVIFSFSLFIWLRLIKKGPLGRQIAVCLVLIYAGDFINVGFIQYMPMFLLGVTFYVNREALEAMFVTVKGLLPSWSAVPVISILLCAPYCLSPLLGGRADSIDIMKNALYLSEFSGLFLALAYALWGGGLFGKFLTSKFTSRMGALSYSTYLVHQTALLWVRQLHLSELATFALGLTSSLVLAWVFYEFLEKHVHQLARRIASTKP